MFPLLGLFPFLPTLDGSDLAGTGEFGSDRLDWIELDWMVKAKEGP